MNKRYLKQLAIALVLMAILALIGCRTVPVYNVVRMPVHIDSSSYTAEDVKKAIIRAGISLGWRIKSSGPGKLVGTLNLRKHTAVIDIPYSKEGYSLIYRDSSELLYDPEKGEIHKNYNSWIQNLDRAIRQITSNWK